MSPRSRGAARERTRAHYDRHPFGFDQEEILAEKLERADVSATVIHG